MNTQKPLYVTFYFGVTKSDEDVNSHLQNLKLTVKHVGWNGEEIVLDASQSNESYDQIRCYRFDLGELEDIRSKIKDSGLEIKHQYAFDNITRPLLAAELKNKPREGRSRNNYVVIVTKPAKK